MAEQSTNNPLRNLKDQEAVLVYFFSNHCAPCLSLRPKIEEMINSEFPKMKLIYIDAETHPEISASHQVFGSPTILLYFDGRETKRFSKYISTNELEQTIGRYYQMIFEE